MVSASALHDPSCPYSVGKTVCLSIFRTLGFYTIDSLPFYDDRQIVLSSSNHDDSSVIYCGSP